MEEFDPLVSVTEDKVTEKTKKVTKTKLPRKNAKAVAPTESISLEALAAKLEVLENELSVKDEKIAKIEQNQLTREIGEDEFGIGHWKKLTRGKDKGYIRQIYIDAEAMVSTSPRTRF